MLQQSTAIAAEVQCVHPCNEVEYFCNRKSNEEHYWNKRFLVGSTVMEEGVGVLMKKSERTELAELRRLPAGSQWHRILL